MEQEWRLIVADFRREYQITPAELARMFVPEFMCLLTGLSARARFTTALSKRPKRLYDPNAIAAVKAAARR